MLKRMTIRRGFTMAECMIAIGILGIGMVMVAALFPAAIKEAKSSSGNVVGEIIAQNGATLSPLLFENTMKVGGAALSPLNYDTYFANQNHYPTGQADSRLGFLALTRQLSLSPMTCELVIIAYRKQEATTTVELAGPFAASVGSGATSFTLSDAAQATYFKAGSCLIADPKDASSSVGIGKVGNASGTSVRLEEAPASGGTSVWTVVEKEGSDILPISPVIYTMTKRVCFPSTGTSVGSP